MLLAVIIMSKRMTGTKILIFEPPELVGMRETFSYFLMHAGMLRRGNQLFWYTESLPIWLDLWASVHQGFIYLYLQITSDLTNLQHCTQLLYECCLSQLRFSFFHEITTLWWLNHMLSIKSKDYFFKHAQWCFKKRKVVQSL